MIELDLSDGALKNGTQRLGSEGLLRWIAELPGRVDLICQRLQLTPVQSLRAGTRGLVLSCSDNQDEPVVLKVPYDSEELAHEYHALQAWHKAGSEAVVSIYAYERGALATWQVDGLASQDDTSLYSPQAFFDFQRKLHIPSEEPLQSVIDNVAARLKLARTRLPALNSPPVSLREVDIALKEAHELASSAKGSTLVHGDLSGANLLIKRSGAGLVACDPKGMRGDNSYDLAMWCLFCQRKGDHAWLDECAERGFDLERIQRWQRVIAVHELIAYVHHDKGHASWPVFADVISGST